jgi:Domain of unknown function (DUF4340)
MKRWKTNLSIILAVQLLMAAALWAVGASRDTESVQSLSLTNFTTDEVDRIEISMGDDRVKIQREGGTWKVPDFHSLSADQAKVKDFLNDLKDLKILDRVAHSESSQKRFEVADDKVNTRVKLFKGDSTLCDLFLGKSPSFGKRYVRRDGENEIFSVRWNSLSVQAQGKAWFDRTILEAGSVTRLDVPDLSLEKDGATWKSSGTELDSEKVANLISNLEKLQVFDVADFNISAGYTALVTTADGSQKTYTFTQRDDKHYVKRDDIDLVFQLSASVLESLKAATLDSLKKVEP